MELRHLRYFVLVAEELHFGRAAQRAGIAQPPLSQQIRSLEADLGVQLFNRTKRRVELTEAGHALLPEARQMLRNAERAEQAARDAASGMTGRLGVGFVGSVTFGILPEFIRRFRAEHPAVRLDLQELTSEQQKRALREGTIDIGLVRYPFFDPDIHCERIAGEPLRVALPAGHQLALGAEPLPVVELAAEPFIIFPRHYGPQFFDQIMGLCRDAGFTPEIAQEAIQMTTIVSLVSAGLGVAIVPGPVEHVRLPGLTYRSIATADGTHPSAQLNLATRTGPASPILENTIAVLTGIDHSSF